jgi:NitT/TauT family transport system permease protein
MLAGLALFYGLLSLAHYWASPVGPRQVIDLHPSALPKYAFFSVARITLAYFVSLIFTLVLRLRRRS